jgi:aryl-alcohol dehydrogenase-like predicted oxidoreductase
MPPFRQDGWAGPSMGADGMSTFALGRMQVRRLGFGAMQLAGPFAFGTPPDRASAIGVLRAAVAAGVDHIDTAQYYGPGVVNDLIREALYPYPDGLAIVSKVAVRRDDSGAVLPFDDPDQLRDGIEDNLRSLRVGQLAAVNLRLSGDGRVDARFDDQLAAMVAARDEGLIAGVGLSNVSLEQLRHTVAGTDIVCVQNLFHLADRRDAPLLEECLSRGIAFVPFCPLGWPRGPDNPVLTSPVVIQTAARLGITPAQAALRWLLQLAPNVLLIPGTGSVAHLRENMAAEGMTLDDEALRQLDGVAPPSRRAL